MTLQFNQDKYTVVMTYRRSKHTAEDKRRYAEFCAANFELMREIGLPGLVYEEHGHFIYVLMHGALRPHVAIRFDVSDFDSPRYALWKELVKRYLEAGFPDPGLCTLSYGNKCED